MGVSSTQPSTRHAKMMSIDSQAQDLSTLQLP